MVDAAGLEETTWLPFSADSSVTAVETSGPKSVVTDLLVRGLVMSFLYVEALSVIELWTCDAVTCLVVRWVFTVSDTRSLVRVTAGPVMV